MNTDKYKVTLKPPVNLLFTEAKLKRENLAYLGTAGASRGNCGNGFIPAFRDADTGRVEISRFQNGQPAPMHIIEGLPESWVIARDADSKVTVIKHTVVAGFLRGDCFYTRSQAAEAVLAESTSAAVLQEGSVCG